jgi:glycosyltransferase involved in cell wall biosynthesis
MQPEHISEGSRLPLFTIAIPTFNRAKWLARCVPSALAQEHDSFEVLVSDNASDDATSHVLDGFSDPRLITIRQPRNIGPIANWNACVEQARGEFIVMLSDDDYLAPHFLGRCDDVVHDRTRPVRVIVALGDVVDPGSGWKSPAQQSRVVSTGIRSGTAVLAEFLLGAISPQMCTVAVRTESLREAGGFPQGWHHAGDLVTWVPLLLEGDVGFVNEACGTHSTHADAQTAGMSLETRLGEIDRLGRVLLEGAAEIDDPGTAASIGGLTRRYVARNLVGHIGSERRSGARRRELVSSAWRWRHRLVDLRAADLRATVRPIALFVAPSWVAGKVSKIKRGVATRADASPPVPSLSRK